MIANSTTLVIPAATTFAAAALAVLAATTHAAAQSPTTAAPAASATNSTNIEWVLPGNFEVARSRAAKEERILIVKGVSFGIDSIGAGCAQKGRW